MLHLVAKLAHCQAVGVQIITWHAVGVEKFGRPYKFSL